MTGRNDPCPCGSGIKYKKCCLGRPSIEMNGVLPTDHPVLGYFAKKKAEQDEYRRDYGDVRPPMAVEHQGRRFVVVGNAVHQSADWRTFPDFLLYYIKHIMGKEWWTSQRETPTEDRHEIMKWYDHFKAVEAGLERSEDGLCAVVPDGISNAYLLLAYDMYALRHHGKLQDEVVRRLRKDDQFYGARYELFVAATFVRAGFDVEYEDESDATRKHPEFLATHGNTGLVLAVEAKARHRTILELEGDELADAMRHPKVRSILERAAEKRGDEPLVAMVELSLPPSDSSAVLPWIPGIEEDLDRVVASNGGECPFDLVMFTNTPHRYGRQGEPDPLKHLYAMLPEGSRIPESIADKIGESFTQYGQVPQEFPVEDEMV